MVEGDEILRQQILACTLRQMSQREIAEELKISRPVVNRIRKQKEFQDLLKAESEEAVRVAREMFRQQLNEMTPLAVKALKQNLKDGKIEGVKVFMEAIGLKQQEIQQQDTTIQVVLPNLMEEKQVEAIEVKNATDI